MTSRFIYFLYFLALALSLCASAQAQTTAPNTYDEVPDEYLKEADNFHRLCASTDSMNLYYNCECLAVKYLDSRIADGPEPSQNSIMLSLQGECRDATLAAGAEYQRCYETAELLPQGTNIEKHCACVANTYAKMFQNTSAQATSRTFVNLKAKADLLCQDPVLAREIYPDLIGAQ